MAFALTGFRALAESTDEANSSRFRQVFVYDITSLATDVTLDLEDDAGTFWTDVDTSSGSIGEKAQKAKNDLIVAAEQIVAIESEALLLKQKIATGAALGAGQYKLSFTSKIPAIEFQTAEAPTSWTLRIEYDLKKDVNPILVEA